MNKSTGKYKRFYESKSINENEMNQFILNKSNLNSSLLSLCAFGVYLLNPFTISSCIATSTVLIHNLILSSWLYFLLNNQIHLALLFLAIHSNISVYSFSLITATICYLYQNEFYMNKNKTTTNSKQLTISIIKYLGLLCLYSAVIFGLNLYLQDFNTSFIEHTYLFILKVPDLVPNLGLFWYFFTEMFDHFRLFFTYVFQMNTLIYAIPLTIRLRNQPIVNIIVQIGLLSVLKSYPNVGETGYYLSFLPIFVYLFHLSRNFLIYLCMLISSTVLAPVMLYLWLGSGGGNANFYFAITIVYSVGQIFLLVDILYAHLKREFIMINGSDVPKNKDGSMALFSLE